LPSGQGGLARAGEDDYEHRLDAARRWAKEWHFRAGVHFLRGLTDAAEAGRQYADLAAATLAALLPVVVEHFAAKHGAPPGRGLAVFGMGSLGAGWLTAGSDLDLIVIYDPAGQEAEEGAARIDDRKGRKLVALFLDELDDVSDRLVGLDGHGVLNEAVDVILHAGHFLYLLLERHVVVDQPETAVERHLDGHARLGHRVHVRRHDRNVQIEAVR
jgi:threonine dehydrogenase-like Zn-dependent dehydrogenase